MKTLKRVTMRLRLSFVVIALLTSFLVMSCKDDSLDEVKVRKSENIEVRYEVVTASAGWFGEYVVESGEKICHCSAPLLPSGWTYSFNVEEKPFNLHIDATVDGITGEAGTPDITTNIYVNDQLVASNTSNWTRGVASADYEVK
jgi:hypothetical protein